MRPTLMAVQRSVFSGASCSRWRARPWRRWAALTMIVSWNDLLTPLVLINKDKLWTLPLGTMQFQGQYGSDLALDGGFCNPFRAACDPFLLVRRTPDRGRSDRRRAQRLI